MIGVNDFVVKNLHTMRIRARVPNNRRRNKWEEKKWNCMSGAQGVWVWVGGCVWGGGGVTASRPTTWRGDGDCEE
jgi:hypothetical protein